MSRQIPFTRPSSVAAATRQSRAAFYESLESRTLFSGTDPTADPAPAVDNTSPRVEAVYVNSTSWSQSFRDAIAAEQHGSSQLGVEAPRISGSGEDVKNKVLPWINLNQVSIQFSENVVVQQDDLTITGVNGTYTVTGFSYNPDTFVATWTLDQPIKADRITLRIDGTSETGVTDVAGNPLNGNGGGGEGGGSPQGSDFVDVLAVLPGDVTRDGRVNAIDLGAEKARWNTSTTELGREGGARYTIFFDTNGDGRINAIDLGAVKARLNNTLPDNSGDGSATALVRA